MPAPTVIVDTREQQPVDFGQWPTVARALRVGDYTLVGHSRSVLVERKSRGDFFHSFTGRRRGPMREKLAALGVVDSPLLLVESTVGDLLRGGSRSGVDPTSLVGSVLSICASAGVTVAFCEPRDSGAVLKSFFRAYLRGERADPSMARRRAGVYGRRKSV